LHNEFKAHKLLSLEKKYQSNVDLKFNKNISLEDVSFSYKDSDLLFEQLNISIKKNTFVAFVGETGSGKSTLADMLMALLCPSNGMLHIDRAAITLDNAHQWQKRIGYVPQTIFLTDDTILANIALGIDPALISLERIELVSRLANIHDFIVTDLPNGYDSLVGDRGVRLSGGQRQRIGIARALYNDPEVLIFDEATNALDGITESTVIDALNSLSGQKTIIVIAHRLTTIISCDIIYLLGKGTLLDKGTYKELIENNSRFKAMVKHS
jgi:ATP-binding cassette, subfamily B, bacterial PglK